MATTSVSNTGTTQSTAAQVAAANKANAQKIMTKLGAGSGVDVASLAQNLVDAEKMPKANAINAKIAKNDARISGYSAVSFVVNEVQTALAALKDQTSFSSVTAVSSNPSAFTVSAGATAATGAHEVEVLQLAKPQRMVSFGYASPTASLNSGGALTLNLTLGGVAKTPITLAAGKDTPQNLVNAINSANTGVKAQLINTGNGSANPYKMVLTGPTGSTGAFSLGVDIGNGLAGAVFNDADPSKQNSSDAML